jgi:hypothetical protein
MPGRMDKQCRIFSWKQLDSILLAGALKQINATPRRPVHYRLCRCYFSRASGLASKRCIATSRFVELRQGGSLPSSGWQAVTPSRCL